MYATTEIDQLFSIDCMAKTFSIRQRDIKDAIIEQLEKKSIVIDYDYRYGSSCWSVTYTIPVCGHMQVIDDDIDVKPVRLDRKIVDPTFVYSYTVSGPDKHITKKLCPLFMPEIEFDDDTIGHLKFTLRHAKKNKNYSQFASHIYTRATEKSLICNNPADMDDIIVETRNESSVTHLEIVGYGIETHKYDKCHHAISHSSIEKESYIKSCELYYKGKQSGKWNLLDRIKCNINPYDPVVIDLRQYYTSSQIANASAFRLRPIEWNVRPLFRLSVYGHSSIKKTPSFGSETVDYTICFPRRLDDFAILPKHCGRDCRMCHSDQRQHNRTRKTQSLKDSIL